MHDPMPTLFVSHGPPTVALFDTPATRFFKGLGRTLPRPTVILCVSAHWEAVRPMVSAESRPETIHDFGGPPPLFSLRYPAPGSPELAGRVADRLRTAGFDAGLNPDRGLDHGAWVPLSLIFPDADIPVLQLSVQTELDAAHHLALGRALAPLRNEGVLILGSGGATHNLEEIHGRRMDDPPEPYAAGFDDWLEGAVAGGRTDALLEWRDQGPSAGRNHPYPSEHLLPFFVPLGAASPGTCGRRIHHGFMYGLLSMAAFRWDR